MSGPRDLWFHSRHGYHTDAQHLQHGPTLGNCVPVTVRVNPGDEAARLRYLAEQILAPDALVGGGESEELARTALALLRERDEARRRYAELLDEKFQEGCDECDARRLEAEDALAALMRERDEARQAAERRCIKHAAVEVLNGDCPICDVEEAEAQRDEVRQALRDLLAMFVDPIAKVPTAEDEQRVVERARAVLGSLTEGEHV